MRKEILASKTVVALVAINCLLLFVGCRDNHSQLDVVALYSNKSAKHSETISLSSDGSYLQSQKYRESVRTPGLFPIRTIVPVNLKREGAWKLLSKENGTQLSASPDKVLPADAVVYLSAALPFFAKNDNAPSSKAKVDRTILASSFQIAH